MCGNFDFLKGKKEFESFTSACLEAEKGIIVSPANCAILSRRALELAVKWVYSFDTCLKVPYQDNLSSLIHEPSFRDVVDEDLFPLIKYIIKLGNVAVHTNSGIKREEAILSLHNLHQFVSWIDYCYALDYTANEFDESILYKGEEKRTRPEELLDLYEKLSSKDKRLEQMIKENEALRKQLTERRVKQSEDYSFEVDKLSEYETRKRYIDLDLKLAGWEIGQDVLEEVEVTGMPTPSGNGFADYVLYGNNGKPLAVVEAKKSSVDPKVGQQQAKLYADCLERRYNQRPIIFFTNGYETYLWDDVNYPERKVSGIFTKEELQLMVDRRQTMTPVVSCDINDDISSRPYQKEAILRVCEAIDRKQRKMLLVMATGTGKTRTAISIVDVLAKHNYVKNVLFLADRKALVKQAKNNFSQLLPNLSLCNLLDQKEKPEQARMIFSTYPTMMNAIDEAKRKDGKKLFTPGHFDLIIVDESHRSIYKKYQAIFDYFDALLIGLTATPKDEIDKNTYSVFELENGVPTFAYELEEAVEGKYLVSYRVYEIKSKIMEEGIKYDQLSEDEKDQFDEFFEEDEAVEDTIDSAAVNEWLFNADTIDTVLCELMEKGLRIEGGDKLGKTIIFAKSSKHAKAIVERFNSLYPEYGGNYAKVIDYSTKYVDTLIDDFSDPIKMPQIAVSVDMLDTGIDIPQVLNLVFFKKVRSKSKFHQMIGRGTRLCKDLLGLGEDKQEFLIFDFCNNFEFFRLNPRGMDSKIGETLTEKIFNHKVEIIKELQELTYQEPEYMAYRESLLNDVLASVRALNEDSFRVRMNLKYVHKYKNQESWASLGAVSFKEIKDYISPLIIPMTDDELAKRFDHLVYVIELAYLQNKNAGKPIRSVVETAESLSKLGTIAQVVEQRAIIEKVQTNEFWESASIFDLEEVREALRDLIKLLEKETQKIYYTNFKDQIIEVEESGPIYGGNDLKNYRKKVEHYLHEHRDELAIYKLRNNKELTKQDIETLEALMWTQLGTKEDYQKEFGETPVTKLVRKIVGMEKEAAQAVFSEFLSDQSLNVSQLKFIELLVDYIVANGFIEDNRVLTEDPFRSVGSIIDLFDTQQVHKLVGRINEIKSKIEIA
ncbi:MAG: DEAD/DEAH box helicase family protein [Turicibacter sp.]|nr:DEAD/DEAH box helicase family protein [Turicibacter sp.]